MCAALSRSPIRIAPKSLLRPATTTGIRACSCGRRGPWPMRCASTCRRRLPCLSPSPRPRARREFDEVFRTAVSQVRKHLRRLCRAGAALGQGRAPVESLLHSGRVQLERSRLVGLALRVPAGDAPARRRRRQRGRYRRPHLAIEATTTTSSARRSLSRWWAWRIWSLSTPKTRC